MGGAFTAFKKRAYVLIEVDPGQEGELVSKLENIQSISNVDFVHGSYDIVCVMEGDYQDIDTTVIQIRKLSHVRKTITLTAFDTALQ